MENGYPTTSKKATRVGFALWAWIAAALAVIFLVWWFIGAR